MSFCNFKADKSEDDEDFIFDDSTSDCNEYRTNSSSSSLKWSVDSRKQNEEDWQQIERVLYGEESLPEDEKTKEEFESWMLRFPHLRVVGTKINLPLRSNQRTEFISNEYEEVIAIDPAPHYRHEPFKMLDQELNEKLSLRRVRQPSGSSQLRTDDLEKLLRITSSSGISRNQQQQMNRMQQNKKVVDRTSTFIIKQNSVGLQNTKKLSKIQEHKKFELTPVSIIHHHRELDNKLSFSATSPYVKSVKSASKLPFYADIVYERQKIPKNEFSSKSASIHHHKKVNPNNIQLPPFNYDDLDFPSFIQVRGYDNQKSSKFMKH